MAYGIAIGATLVFDAIWLALPGDWGEHIPFSLFFSVVGVAALVGGFWPGMVATILGAFSGLYLGEPRFTFTLSSRGEWLLLWVFVVISPLASLGGAALGRALEERRLALKDTERRAHEEAARLNARLSELLESERAARAEAERASRLKDDFMATVSHELRTPLGAVLGWARLSQGPEVNPATRARGLGIIVRNAQALEHLIGDLLDVGRAGAGKMRLEMARQSLPAIVEAALEGSRSAATAKRIAIHTDLAPAEVLGDSARLQQIVWNLVSNAVKFTPEGGEVRVSTGHDEAGRVVLRVCDTGEGIDPGFLPHVFERFRQANASTSRRHGGLGLGLAITKHLVELQGGTVAAFSEGRGRGAELTVTLPTLRAGSEGRAPGAAKVAPGTLAGMSVLVVDDDPDVRELVQRLLESHGAEVQVAGSGQEALDVLGVLRPRVVVSDVSMPGMDGYELVRRLHAQHAEGVPEVPAIALTAHARPEDRDRAFAAGFLEHVTKPIDEAALVAAIRTAWRSSAGTPRPS